ncbi:22892_t:CDS:1, partial [Dentiscutata erythropus]
MYQYCHNNNLIIVWGTFGVSSTLQNNSASGYALHLKKLEFC